MPTDQLETDAAPASTLDRASLVLDLFRDGAQLALIDVSRRTGIPRTSALRMLGQLVRLGWLKRDGVLYELGDALVELGSDARHSARIERSVAPLLDELHQITGCVVHLGALENGEIRYLGKSGASPSVVLPTRVGSRVPARVSTIGKALVRAGLPAGAPPRNRDSRVAFGRCTSGHVCIGTYVGMLGGAPVGLSVTGPAQRMRFDEWHAAPVRMAAAAIAPYLAQPLAG